ncbi:MAG: hypothetical protein ACYS5V_16970, partial [Planctomycetota bacterium]
MVESLAYLDGVAQGLYLAGMWDWWSGLSGLIKGFYVAAFCFSGLFLWQLIGALVGLAGSEDMDVDGGADVDVDVGVDMDVDHPEFEHGAIVDGAETVAAFKLLSIRSVLAFLMLFTWAGALYMDKGDSVSVAMLKALLWGTASMLVVAGIFYLFRRMTEMGSQRIGTCLGTRGT